MAISIHEEYIRILIQARNESAAAFKSAAADVTGFRATLVDAGKGLMLGGVGVAAVGVGLGLGVAALTKAGMDYQTMLSQLQANTTITNEQIGLVSADILRLRATTGAPLQELADSFRHVTDAGFSVADAMAIVQQGTMSAVSTGANAADINNTLAIVMHEFGMSAAEAARAVNVLHLASAMSNTTMEQFATGTAKAQAFAANLGVAFVDTEAALSALGRRFSASQSSTMFAGELVKIVASSKGAEAQLKALQERTGIPLVRDFTAAGLASRGFTQVQADLAQALKETGVQALKIIPATRGGLAEMVLGGSGAMDYRNAHLLLADTMAGKTNPTMEAFMRQQHTLAGELMDLRGQIDKTAVTIGLQLVPELQHTLANMTPLISRTLDWASAHARLIAELSPKIVIAVTTVGVAAALGGISLLAAALLSNPLGLAIAATTVAVGGLTAAWLTDFGHIRERVAEGAKALDDIQKGKPSNALQDLFNAVHIPALDKSPTWGDIARDPRLLTPGISQFPLPFQPGGVFGPPVVPPPAQATLSPTAPLTSDWWQKWSFPSTVPIGPTIVPPAPPPAPGVRAVPLLGGSPLGGAMGSSSPIHIQVTVSSGAVTVQGADGTGVAKDLGQRLGDHVAKHLRSFMAAEENVTPAPRSSLAGARAR